MSKHRFRVTVESMDDQSAAPLSFEVENHDDIIGIVERLKGRDDLEPGVAESLGVGLKLFGEVIMSNREAPLFKPLLPHFGEFMKRLKGKA